MDKGKVYKIIPVEFVNLEDGAYILKSPDGEQYKVTGGNIPTKKGNLIRLDKKTFLRLMNDIVLDDELEEIVIVNDETDVKSHSYLNLSPLKERSTAVWPLESTRILVDMYRDLRPLVFKAEIRSMKQMWEIIAENLKQHGFDYDFQQVESKWKSLVRSYRVGLILGPRRKSHYLAAPFEKDIGEILKMMKKIPFDKELDATNASISQPSPKRCKLEPTEEKPDKDQSEMCNEEIVSKHIFKLNTEEINNNLSQIVKAIEARTSKREKAEQKSQEQRERLIKAIEKGNELLSQLLQKA